MKELQLLDEIDQLNEEITDLAFDVAKMMKNPEVELYVLKSTLLRDLIEKRRILNEKYSKIIIKECSHLILYELDSYIKDNKPYYLCKCLDCGYVLEKNDSKNIITTEKSFERVKFEYKKMECKTNSYLESKKDNSINIYNEPHEVTRKLIQKKFK